LTVLPERGQYIETLLLYGRKISMNDRNCIPRPDLSVREIDGETVILDRNTEEIHTLNKSASYVWSRLNERSSRDAIVDGFLELYEIDKKTAETDVDAILSHFQALKLFE